MNPDYSIPPLRDLPPGRLVQRAQHLRAEIVEQRRPRAVVQRPVLTVGVALALVLSVVLLATPAFGLRGQVIHLFGGGKPAPAPVVKSFAELDVGAPPGMAPNVIAGETREVMESHLSTGKKWVMWVAPTRAGGFCMPDGCDRDRSIPFSLGLSIPGPISPEGAILAPPVIFEGDTLIPGATTVEIRFEDGGSATTPVVWVSPPIDAGFFIYELPEARWKAGHRPVALVLKDGNGNELARNTEIVRGLIRIQSGRLTQPTATGSPGR
jgi:hypothetical protein